MNRLLWLSPLLLALLGYGQAYWVSQSPPLAASSALDAAYQVSHARSASQLAQLQRAGYWGVSAPEPEPSEEASSSIDQPIYAELQLVGLIREGDEPPLILLYQAAQGDVPARLHRLRSGETLPDGRQVRWQNAQQVSLFAPDADDQEAPLHLLQLYPRQDN